jgi:hypothetical protein
LPRNENLASHYQKVREEMYISPLKRLGTYNPHYNLKFRYLSSADKQFSDNVSRIKCKKYTLAILSELPVTKMLPSALKAQQRIWLHPGTVAGAAGAAGFGAEIFTSKNQFSSQPHI